MKKQNWVLLKLFTLVVAVLLVLAQHQPAYAGTPACKAGFKLGQTPLSLVTGSKTRCISKVQVSAGSKILTATSKACYICHSTKAAYPPKQMLANLKAQGYTLSPRDISASFKEHESEMSGGPMSSKEAKAISQYLQSIK